MNCIKVLDVDIVKIYVIRLKKRNSIYNLLQQERKQYRIQRPSWWHIEENVSNLPESNKLISKEINISEIMYHLKKIWSQEVNGSR